MSNHNLRFTTTFISLTVTRWPVRTCALGGLVRVHAVCRFLDQMSERFEGSRRTLGRGWTRDAGLVGDIEGEIVCKMRVGRGCDTGLC